MTTPGDSLGPEAAPASGELPDGLSDADGSCETSDEPGPGDQDDQGSPVLDDQGQPMPGQSGEPSS